MDAKWLKNRRKQLGITQRDLVARLGSTGYEVVDATLSHWENGRYAVPLENEKFRQLLANALEMSVPAMLKAAGYETHIDRSKEAILGADLIDQLPDSKRAMAIGILETLVKGK